MSLGFVVMLAGCGTVGIQGTMQKASRQVDRSLENGYAVVYSKPVDLRVRLHPCECEEPLEFEAEIYGEWRHVMVIGSRDALDLLRKRGMDVGSGNAFEANFILQDDLYVSARGQSFYTLEIVE